MARTQHQRQAELWLAAWDGQHQKQQGSAFFSAHTHLCALLVAMTGSHSRRWEAHNYSHTKRGFKMVKDSKGKFLIPADFIVKSAFSIAEIRYEVSTSTHSLAMVLACPLVPGPWCFAVLEKGTPEALHYISYSSSPGLWTKRLAVLCLSHSSWQHRFPNLCRSFQRHYLQLSFQFYCHLPPGNLHPPYYMWQVERYMWQGCDNIVTLCRGPLYLPWFVDTQAVRVGCCAAEHVLQGSTVGIWCGKQDATCLW